MNNPYLKPFIERINAEGLNVYGVTFFKDNELVDSYRWKPDVPVNMWSHTKCFTSAAVGIAIAEGKLSLEDKAAEFFPEYLPENPDPRWLDVTLKNLLMMSSGVGQMLLAGPLRDDRDYQCENLPKDKNGNPCDLIEYIFSHEIKNRPGEKFSYNNGDADLAARMVEKAVGMTMRDYLYQKLFKPMGISYPECDLDLRGHTYGDSGLRMTTYDMASLSRLYVNDGMWNNIELIPKNWIEESTKKQIETIVPGEEQKHFDPWNCGYGYLVWMFPKKNSYRFSGMFGQNSLVFPEQKIIFNFNSNVKNLNALKAAAQEELVDRFVK